MSCLIIVKYRRKARTFPATEIAADHGQRSAVAKNVHAAGEIARQRVLKPLPHRGVLGGEYECAPIGGESARIARNA
jgi:hypothetical protein